MRVARDGELEEEQERQRETVEELHQAAGTLREEDDADAGEDGVRLVVDGNRGVGDAVQFPDRPEGDYASGRTSAPTDLLENGTH